jgi:hypothetical protein
MRKSFISHRPEVILGLATGVAMLVCSAQALSQPSVRAELIRLQDEKGLTLAWVDNGILTRSIDTHTPMSGGVQAIMFKKRTIVRLKDSLQDFRPDTFDLREYPQLSGIGECWSYDQTKLVDTMIERPSGRATLTILDLASKLVYEMDDAVRLYELGTDRSDAMAKGTDPTWSPDGSWIAFRDQETYYAVHPDGTGRKKLFHNHWGGVRSGLYWSPDSRFVAYVKELGFLQGGALDAEVNQLRVRRLEDGSDEPLCPDSVSYENYRWITSGELMKHSRSESPH